MRKIKQAFKNNGKGHLFDLSKSHSNDKKICLTTEDYRIIVDKALLTEKSPYFEKEIRKMNSNSPKLQELNVKADGEHLLIIMKMIEDHTVPALLTKDNIHAVYELSRQLGVRDQIYMHVQYFLNNIVIDLAQKVAIADQLDMEDFIVSELRSVINMEQMSEFYSNLEQYGDQLSIRTHQHVMMKMRKLITDPLMLFAQRCHNEKMSSEKFFSVYHMTNDKSYKFDESFIYVLMAFLVSIALLFAQSLLPYSITKGHM